MRRLWTMLVVLMLPLLWWRLARRARHEPLYGERRWQRLGRDLPAKPRAPRATVWVHAVSLGETRAALPLLHALLRQGHGIWLTHTTATGMAEGARLMASTIAEGALVQSWFPWDLPGAYHDLLNHVRPCACLLIETEVWPNLMAVSQQRGLPVALVSARLSEASLRRARRWRALSLPAYRALSAVLAQTAEDAQRLQSLGAPTPVVVGNLKFDVEPPADLLRLGRQWRRQIQRPVVLMASTREGEEVALLQAWQARPQALAQAVLLLVPRHPQRFEVVADILREQGLTFARRSQLVVGDALSPQVSLVLGDSLGEMPLYAACADVALMGGSFAPLGGQNLIEVIACGTPVIMGPHSWNFEQATQSAVSANAALQVADAQEAVEQASRLLLEPPRRLRMVEASLAFTQRHAGAADRIMQALQPFLLSATTD
jgi:3-deoxy-D-manno-octulosonic-acid transferase